MELTDLATNQQYQALSPEAKGLVFDKLAAQHKGYAGLSPEAQGAVREKLTGAAKAKEKAPADGEGAATSLIGGVAEPIAQAATGMVAQPLANIAGLAAIPAHAMGLTKMEPEAVKAKVGEALTYQPKTAGGKAVAESPYNPLNMIGGVVEGAAEGVEKFFGKDTAAGRAAAEAVRQGPAFLGPKGGKLSAAKLAERRSAQQAALHISELQHAERNALLKTGQEAGFKFTPEEAGGPGGRALQGASAMPIMHSGSWQNALENRLSLHNANAVDALGRKELGLGEAATLSEETLQHYRQKQAAPYNSLEGLNQPMKYSPQYRSAIDNLSGNLSEAADKFPSVIKVPEVEAIKRAFSIGEGMTTTEAVQAMRYLRDSARDNLGPMADPKSKTIGKVQKNAAKAIEDLMEEHLTQSGQAGLMEQFRTARTNLAKSYTIEEAMKGGRLSGIELAKLRKSGTYLSGGLELAAKMAEHHPAIMRDTTKLASKRTGMWADVALASGAAFMGQPTLAAALGARPVIRSTLASDWYQKRFIGAPKYKAKGTAFAKAIEKIGMLGVTAPSQAELRKHREDELKAAGKARQ